MGKIQFSATKLYRCVYAIIIRDVVQCMERYVQKPKWKFDTYETG